MLWLNDIERQGMEARVEAMLLVDNVMYREHLKATFHALEKHSQGTI